MNKIDLLSAKKIADNYPKKPILGQFSSSINNKTKLVSFLNNSSVSVEEKRQKLVEIRRIGEEVRVADLMPTAKVMDWIFENYSWNRIPKRDSQFTHFIFDVDDTIRFEFEPDKPVGEGRWISLRRKEKRNRKIVSSLGDAIGTKITETLLPKLM